MERPRGRLKEGEIRVGSDMDMMGPCIFTPVEMPEKHKAKSTLGVLPAPKRLVGPDTWLRHHPRRHGGQRAGHSRPTFLIFNMRGQTDQASELPSDPKVGTVSQDLCGSPGSSGQRLIACS